MFHKTIKTGIKKPLEYRTKDKTLVKLNTGEVYLNIVNYKGVNTKLHGCLVAEFYALGKFRGYRCKYWNNNSIILHKIVIVNDFRKLFKEIRSYINLNKG